MSATGLSEVYRYGVRFVGYLIAVTLVGGVFVAGGAALGGSILLSAVGSGGVAAVASGKIVAAVALVSIGLLLFLAGIVGLLHKLIVDAAMTGVVNGHATWMNTSETEAPDQGGDADQTPDVSDADETDAGTAVPGVADDATVADSSSEPASDAQAISKEQDAPTDGPVEADSEVEADSPPDDDTLAETDPNATVDDSVPGESSDDNTTQTPEPDAEPVSRRPEEWSPPDKSEFQPADSATSSPTENAESGGESSEWEPTESEGESTDGPRTADELFSEETDSDEATIRDIADLLSEDGEEQVDADESGELSEHRDTGNRPDDESRFDTDTDSDPLSDALDDS
jgi:hypothetical protein